MRHLNLRNPKVYELASELADLTGESLADAVIAALEMRLIRERQKRSEVTAEKILEFAHRFAPGMRLGSRSIDHAEELYGEDGLPK